jgi:tetratricopeptide (TPR) repeat protein
MPRRPLPLLVAAAILFALAACAAHEKAGDRAAAVGDWKTAERAYGEAARRSPEKKELQEKHRQAKAAAVDGAAQKATACAAARDWECAYAESSYAVDLEPGRVELATFRRDAAREAALQRVARARDLSARGDHRGALGLLESARQASDDPRVVADARKVSPGVVDGATFEAEALRAKARFPEALELYAAAARVDPAVQPRLEVVTAEYERWKDVEAERLAVEGDALLAARRYAEAQARYDAAVQLRPNGRAASLSRQAALLARGHAATEARDFAAAERHYGEASRLPGASALALAELDRVKVRPWAIRVRSVLVRPVRPDGRPWTGSRSFALDRLVDRLDRVAGRATPAGLALDLARRVPRENQPTLVVTAGLPDGRGLQSRPRRGTYATLDGSFVVASNAYDDRAVSLRVVHDEGRGRPVDVGYVTFRLGDLVAARELAVSGQEVEALRLEADVADLPDGAFSGFLPIPDETNLAETWSLPGPASAGLRIAAADGVLSVADLGAQAATARPQLQVEVEQRGRVVYRSAVVSGRTSAGFTPAAAYLFVAPHETLVLRLVDREGAGVVRVSGTVRGEELLRGGAYVMTPGGSTVRLRVEPRRAGPDAAPRTAAR